MEQQPLVPQAEPPPQIRIHANSICVQLIAVDLSNAGAKGLYLKSPDGAFAFACPEHMAPWCKPGDMLVATLALVKFEQPPILAPQKPGLILPPKFQA